MSKDAPVIDACTIAGNDVVRNDSTQCGGGLYHRWTGSVVNTIVAHNTLNGSLEENKNWFNAIYAVNSCAYPPPSDSRFRAADGCVTTNPLFANTSAGDYGLTVASPCKDTGAVESWMADASDLVGAPRVFGAAPVMGCFERTYPLGTLLLFK